MKWYVLGSLLLAGMMMVCLVCCQTQAERRPEYGLESRQGCRASGCCNGIGCFRDEIESSFVFL